MLQLGRTVPCSWPVNTFRVWPPQLCPAQLPLKSTGEMGACLNHSALFSHQTHFLPHYLLHNSHICVLQIFKNGDSCTKYHFPSSVLPPLHILSSSWLPVHSSLFFPCLLKAFCNVPHLQASPLLSLSHRHIASPTSPCIFYSVWVCVCAQGVYLLQPSSAMCQTIFSLSQRLLSSSSPCLPSFLFFKSLSGLSKLLQVSYLTLIY